MTAKLVYQVLEGASTAWQLARRLCGGLDPIPNDDLIGERTLKKASPFSREMPLFAIKTG